MKQQAVLPHEPPPRPRWLFLPMTSAKNILGHYRLSIRETLTKSRAFRSTRRNQPPEPTPRTWRFYPCRCLPSARDPRGTGACLPHREVGFETSRPCDHRSRNRTSVLTEPGISLFELRRHHVPESLYSCGPPKLSAFRGRPEVLQDTTGLNCPAKKKAYLGEVGFSYFSP